MKNEILKYFLSKCKENDIKVVPGHYPDFKDKEAVNKWISIIKSMLK